MFVFFHTLIFFKICVIMNQNSDVYVPCHAVKLHVSGNHHCCCSTTNRIWAAPGTWKSTSGVHTHLSVRVRDSQQRHYNFDLVLFKVKMQNLLK